MHLWFPWEGGCEGLGSRDWDKRLRRGGPGATDQRSGLVTTSWTSNWSTGQVWGGRSLRKRSHSVDIEEESVSYGGLHAYGHIIDWLVDSLIIHLLRVHTLVHEPSQHALHLHLWRGSILGSHSSLSHSPLWSLILNARIMLKRMSNLKKLI